MAEPPDDGHGLDFSDIDSDNDNETVDNAAVRHSVIAHKEMRYANLSPQEDDGENEFEPISPPLDALDKEDGDGREPNSERFDLVSPVSPEDDEEATADRNFEQISPKSSNSDSHSENMPLSPDENAPVSPTEPEQFEPISPPASPRTAGQPSATGQFENISDDEADGSLKKGKTRDFSDEGRFSPVAESDTELNFDDSSNDSGYHLVSKPAKPLSVQSVASKSLKSSDNVSKSKHSQLRKGLDTEEDVEAPIPSPFSDIGDMEDMSDHDGAIVSDILKADHGRHFDAPVSSHSLGKKDVSSVNKPGRAYLVADGNESEGVLKDTRVVAGPSQDSDEEPSGNDALSEPTNKPALEDEDNDEQNADDVGGLIADIFGESDDEEEEFEGFAEEELLPEKAHEPAVSEEESEDDTVRDKENKKAQRKDQKDEEEEEDEDRMPSRDFVSDFDLMLQKKKEANRTKRRSHKDIDLVNDNDDIIAAMLKNMKEAAEEDRILNQCGKAATKKMRLLETIVCHLRKADLINTFIDSGVLPAMKDWLSPLPDNSLPHINIRKSFLKLLSEFPPLDKGALKMSGIGRAVMLLFKHPKELPENKRLAEKIISNWARPIFNLNTNFKEMSKEEREDRDKASSAAKRPRLSSSEETKFAEDDPNRPRKPGDPGWIGRARVPMPSNRDYMVRPKSRVEGFDVGKGMKTKTLSRFEKQQRKMKDKRTVLSGGNRQAIGISINGTKMAL